MATEHNNPEANAPMIIGIPAKYASTMPGNTACDMASPINDQPFNTKKHDRRAQTIPVASAAIMARCIRGRVKG